MASIDSNFTCDFEAQITCVICSEIFTDPRTLPCLHTLCFKCIKSWNEACQRENKTLECPSCRAEVKIEGGDIEKLPSSFTYNSLLQLFNSMKMTTSEQGQQQISECAGCSNREALVGFCPKCGGMICGECMNAHKTVNLLIKSHNATLWSEFNPEVLNSFINNQASCKEKFHANARLEYYCKTCRKCICQKCGTTTHSIHDKVSIEEAAEDAKTLIRKDKDRLNELLILYKKELELSSENMRRIQSEVDTAKTKVRNNTQALMKILQEHEETTIAALDSIHLDHTTTFLERNDDINADIQTFSDLKQKCKNMEDNNLEHFILESFENLQDVCKTTIQNKSTFSTKPEKRSSKCHYAYIPNPEAIAIMQQLKFGDVFEGMTDPSHCSMESLNTSIKCGFVNEFFIMSKDSDGNAYQTTKKYIDVQIQDADGNVVQAEVIDLTETGRFRVKYIVHKPSVYKVVVKVEGKEIKNSPQKVEAVVKTYRAIRTFGIYRLVRPIAAAINEKGFGAIVEFGSEKNVIALYNFASGQYKQEFTIGQPCDEDDEYRLICGVFFNQHNQLLVSHNPGGCGCIKEFGVDGTCTYKTTLCKLAKGIQCGRMCTADQSIACLCYNTNTRETFIKTFDKQNYDHLHDIKLDVPDVHGWPNSLAYQNKKYFVSFFNMDTVYVFDERGGLLYTFGGKGDQEGQFKHVLGLALYGREMLLVCDRDNHRVQVFSQSGQFISSFGSHGSGHGEMNAPVDISVTQDGKIFVLEVQGHRVQEWR